MATKFEWDENKRHLTLTSRGLDFLDAKGLFDGRQVITIPARQESETRFLTIGRLGGKFHAVVWTWRGESIRIISFRRARVGEESAFSKIHG